MRQATFPLIKLDDRSEDGRLIRSVQIDPEAFPLRVERALNDPLRLQFPAGGIESVVFTDGWVVGMGYLHDDLAMRIFGDGDTLCVEADTHIGDSETLVEDDLGLKVDLHILLTHATIGENPLWDGCEVMLG